MAVSSLPVVVSSVARAHQVEVVAQVYRVELVPRRLRWLFGLARALNRWTAAQPVVTLRSVALVDGLPAGPWLTEERAVGRNIARAVEVQMPDLGDSLRSMVANSRQAFVSGLTRHVN